MLRTMFLIATALSLVAGPNKSKDGYFTTSDNIKIHYLTLGEKGSWVVLIHGYTGNAEHNWFANGIAPALAKNHRVVALDNRNHGMSDKPVKDGAGKASDTIELMDHLKIKKAHIGGYSMGGSITAQLLADHPDRFITAHFGGSGILETDPEWIARLPKEKEGRDVQEDVVGFGLRINHAMDNGMTRAEAEKFATRRLTEAEMASIPKAPPRPVIAFEKLNIPIIIINGEYDRPRAKSVRAAREANDVEIVVLPGKSHLTAIAAGYMPPEYLVRLAAFIDTHDKVIEPRADHPSSVP